MLEENIFNVSLLKKKRLDIFGLAYHMLYSLVLRHFATVESFK